MTHPFRGFQTQSKCLVNATPSGRIYSAVQPASVDNERFSAMWAYRRCVRGSAPRCKKVKFRDGDPKPSINVYLTSLP